jgi:pimeloyl-ACP methyl ester carboxylesterase
MIEGCPTMKKSLLLIPSLLLSGCLSFHQGPLPNEPKNYTFAQVGDTRIRFVDITPPHTEGEKLQTVVLIHGYGASIEEWGMLMPELLKAKYRVIALDLKGHGWSERNDGDYSIQGQARLVVNLLDQRNVDKFSVIGHSWGSAVSLAVALMAPSRVTRVGLYNGMFFQEQQPLIFSWAKVPVIGEIIYGVMYKERQDEKLAVVFYDKEKWVTEEAVDGLEGFMERPGTLAAALAGVRQMQHTELQSHYKDVKQPVLLLWGRDDQVTPLQYGERLLHELPHARLMVYPQCGHVPMMEVPGPTSAELVRFLGEGAQ